MLTKLIVNVILILILVLLGVLLVKRMKRLKKEDEELDKLIEDLTEEEKGESSVSQVPADSAEAVAEAPPTEPTPEIPELKDQEALTEPRADEITSRVKVKDLELSKEDIKKHEKAKRKARVIVREIEMYNKEKTEMGRKGGNLYKYLKDEIEAGRKTYEQAVPEEIRQNTRYYEESLVNLLAKGKKEILGMEL